MGLRRVLTWLATLAVVGAGCAGPGIRPSAVAAPPVSVTSTTGAAVTVPRTVPPEPTTTTTPRPTRVTLSFTGDLLSHSPVYRQAQRNGSDTVPYDYRPMFRLIRDTIAGADLAICHLETPLSKDNRDLSGYPTFSAPRELATAIADAGYDGCSVASNHTYDRGPQGIASTLDALDEVGLGHAGAARSETESVEPRLYEVNGVTIGHLSFTYGLNGFVLPADQPWLVDVTTPEAILGKAAVARRAGADLVVLSIQWGVEYQTDPTPDQIELAETLLTSPDIDLIVGSHAHVIQPLDRIDGEYVLYGLGNFLSNQSGNCCPARTQNGVIVEFVVEGTDRDGYTVTEVRAVPTRVDRSDYTIVPLPTAVSAGSDGGAQSTLEAALEDTIEILTRRGVEVDV